MTMLQRLLSRAAALFSVLSCATAQVTVGGVYTTQATANVQMRLFAFGVPIATTSGTTQIQGTCRTTAGLSQLPSAPVDIPATTIQTVQVDAFDLTATDATLVLNGLRIDLHDFRYRMGDCFGSPGTVSLIPGGVGRMFVHQNNASATFDGSIVLSGGTPPFSFNQSIDLATVGPGDLDLPGLYELVPTSNGFGVQQRLELTPFQLERFDFGGFDLELRITLVGASQSLVGTSPFTPDQIACCGAATPVGTLFDRGGIGNLPSVAGEGVAPGDFDGDGLVDLATAGFQSVRFHRAIGGGAFAAHTEVALPGNLITPVHLLAGDFDGDGDLDLASVSNGTNAAVVMLQNDGFGGFTVLGSFACGVSPNRLAAGDIDGDGDLDLAVASSSFSTPGCELLHNHGNGTFAAPVRLAFGSGLVDVELADLDGDGDLDVVAPLLFQDFFAFRRNNGGGNFATAVGFNTLTRGGDGPADVALGDLDGDGDLDAAVVCANTDNLLLIRNTNGQFSSAAFLTVPIPAADQARLLQLGDLDRDGDLDVVTADFASVSPFRVTTFANDGAGVFGPSLQYAVGGLGRALALADVDGDADLDVAALSVADFTKVLINGCSGTQLPGAVASTFGAGCAGSLGVPVVAPIGRPVLGTAAVTRLTNVPAGLAVFLIGFSDQVANGQPLPLSLTPFGLPAGCAALVSPDVTVWAAHTGTADYVLAVPAAPSLAGLALFVQGGGFDNSLTAAVPLVMGNGVRLGLGL